MKDKDSSNVEDTLAQISNTRTSETALKSLYSKLNYCNLTNLQRSRLLKVVLIHITKVSFTTDLRITALDAGLTLVQTDFSTPGALNGTSLNFLEACCQLVKEHVDNSSCHALDIVKKALEILSLMNTATASKLFYEKKGLSFLKIVKFCMKSDELKLHALSLLRVGLNVPESETLAQALSQEKVWLIQTVYPLIFNIEDSEMTIAALVVMQKLALEARTLPIWNKLKEDTQQIYCKQMVEMVNQKYLNWPKVWQFIVMMFGDELHSGGQLINHMLEVLERAFKHSDFEWTRVRAFDCWNTLIDNFKSGLKNKKRIDLIMIPLKANNHRNETLALAKLNTYNHFLKVLGKDLNAYPDVLINLCTFCFGSEKPTCSPVKSYSALHEKCISSINDVLVSPSIHEFFSKFHHLLIDAVEDCFILENAPSAGLTQLWHSLLDLVYKQEKTEVMKKLFEMVNSLVMQAKTGQMCGSLSSKKRSNMSPPGTPQGPQQPNLKMGAKIVSIVLLGMVKDYPLKTSFLRCRSLYIGTYDVMNGTPLLLFMEWLLSPALRLGAADTEDYEQVISTVISLSCQESVCFLDFTQQILKKLLVFDESLSSNMKISMYASATLVWMALAKDWIEYIQMDGSINQGDAAQHDFQAMYSMLLFPVHLCENFDLVEKCSQLWCNLFYEVSHQAALVPTSSAQLLCEEFCTRLIGSSKRSSSPKHVASIFFLLTCILKVAAARFKSVKRCRWIQEHISSIVKELNHFSVEQESVFNQVSTCIQHCLLQSISVTKTVVVNISATLCLLLKSKSNSCDVADKLCAILTALKEASLTLYQHGCPQNTIKALLKDIILAAKSHSSEKIVLLAGELSLVCDENKSPEKGSRSLNFGNGLSPINRTSSPKPVPKKFMTIQMSPSNLSPGNTKRKIQTTVCESDGKFVRIETPPKKIILTEHQKEVRKERRQDIPALYQDLSQNTQNMSQDASQDFVALPNSPKKKPCLVLDEDAVMDSEDVQASTQVLSGKKFESPRSSNKTQYTLDDKTKTHSFTPPAGFVLTSDTCDSETESTVRKQAKDEIHPGKENEDVATPTKIDKSVKTPRRGATTRSSASTNLTTRSGKVVKRTSLASASELLAKRKSARKSLPVNCSEVPETIVLESDTDTESVSSVTSDTSAAGLKPGKVPISRKKRSFKREMSEDSIELAPELKSSKVGGKVLTRSRSNSSLDDIVCASKKSNGPDSTSKGLSPIVEPKAIPKLSPEPKEKRSKRSSSSPTAVELNEVALHAISDKSQAQIGCKLLKKDGSSPIATVVIEDMPKKPENESTPPHTEGTSKSQIRDSPAKRCLDKLFTATFPQTGISKAAEEIEVSPKSQRKCRTSPIVLSSPGKRLSEGEGEGSPSKDSAERSDLYGPSEIDLDSSDIGTEGSQEIIESSQEPTNNLKECVVALELFRCVDPLSKTEINNVIVEKGPEESSPFKVHPKDTSKVSPTTQKSVCRSLVMMRDEDTTDPSSVTTNKKEIVASSDNKNSSPPKEMKDATSPDQKKIMTDESSKERANSNILDAQVLIEVTPKSSEEDTSEDIVPNGVSIPQARSNSMPEWMHEKKCSPPGKPIRTIRNASSRSQAFMKSVDLPCSPPKGMDVSPISSPVQSKRMQKTDSHSNTTPIIKRSSRAAQLLGLGQAAAARGGETVVLNANRSARSEKVNEAVEDTEISVLNAGSVVSSFNGVSSVTAATTSSSSVISTVSSISSTPMASPSIRRQGRILEIDSLKSTPQKCLEDKGLKEDWVPKTPCAKATPDSSILKRKREADGDAPSPSLKRKRVSFRDPPLTSLLRFAESTETPSTVFSSDRSYDKTTDVTFDHEQVSKQATAGEETERDSVRNSKQRVQEKCSPIKQRDSLQSTASGTEDDQIGSTNGVLDENGPEFRSVLNDNDRQIASCAAINNDLKDIGDIVQNSSIEGFSPKAGNEKGIRPTSDGTEGKVVPSKKRTIDIVTPTERALSSEHLNEEKGTSGHDKCQGSEQVETQGSLDDLYRVPSVLSPVYPNLESCTHSIESILSKLTTAVWKKPLLREFSEQEIRTVGDLAKLTEDRLDRLSVKPPKRTNVFCVLEDFENRHGSLRDDVNCRFVKVQNLPIDTPLNSLKDVLASASDEEIMKTLSELGRVSELGPMVLKSLQPQDVAAVVGSSKNILQCLPVDTVAETYFSQIGKEKNMTVDGLTSILTRVPHSIIQDTLLPAVPSMVSSIFLSLSSDRLLQHVLGECSPSDITKHLLSKVEQLGDGELKQLVAKLLPMVKHLDDDMVEPLVAKLLPKLKKQLFDDIEQLDENEVQQLSRKLLPKLKHLDDDMIEPLTRKLLPKLKNLDDHIVEQLAESLLPMLKHLDDNLIEPMSAKLFPKLNAIDIAQHLDEVKSEETVKVLLSKFNLKKGLHLIVDVLKDTDDSCSCKKAC